MARPSRLTQRQLFAYAVALTVGYPRDEARALAAAWAAHAPGGDGEDYFAGLWCELDEDTVLVGRHAYTTEDFEACGLDAKLAALITELESYSLVTLDETELACELYLNTQRKRASIRL